MFVHFFNLGKVENGNGVESDTADGDGHHEDALHQEGGGEQALVNHHNLVLSTWSQSVFEQNGSFSSCSKYVYGSSLSIRFDVAARCGLAKVSG